MRLDQYLVEDEQSGLGITFIDIDETLFKTYAKIHVVKDGKRIMSLSNSEFNAYKAKEGESFDYSEFRSSKFFYDTSKPIYTMIKRTARIIKRTEPKNSKVIILTARADMDDKEVFLDKFREAGLPIDKAYIERAGNRKGNSIPLIKKNIIMGYLSTGLYRRVRLFDDYLETCKEFLNLQNELPDVTLSRVRERYDLLDVPDNELIHFEAFNVQRDGSLKEVK